jgi:hypothetical protein
MEEVGPSEKLQIDYDLPQLSMKLAKKFIIEKIPHQVKALQMTSAKI